MLHSDCAGEWTMEACGRLRGELATVIAEMRVSPPLPFTGVWQKAVAEARGLNPRNASESFIDVDGEFLLERLLGLVEIALARGQSVLFQ
jgi:hypothetical protein